MAEITLKSLEEAPNKTKPPITPPPKPLPGSTTTPSDTPRSTPKKKQRTKNRGANMIITGRPTGNGKRLLPSEKLAIRAEKSTGLSAEKVAKAYGVAKQTVQRIWKDDRYNSVQERVSRVKKGLSTGLALTAHHGIQQANKTMDKASPKDAALIACMCIDKMRLLDGKSTENQSVHVWMNAINNVSVSSAK